jgi:hypothetical protein
MTEFSLPEIQADHRAAFFDAKSAADWLCRLPQANTSAMLSALLAQIQLLNTSSTPAAERFSILETLRNALFHVSAGCQRRYENKPLPLLPEEQRALNAVRDLWRKCTIAYLHCLQACLDQDASISGHSAIVAHRTLSCLRMEQMNSYLALSEPGADFWHLLHTVFAAAERLATTREPVADQRLGETRESTLSGQYAMAIMLHLVDPFSMPRKQFATVTRWLARWRELANICAQPESEPNTCGVSLDFAHDHPIQTPLQTHCDARWLSLNNVLRKINKRIILLNAGESPENLKLGSGLSRANCVSLLEHISLRLRFPQQSDIQTRSESVHVVPGLENMFLALGGKGLKAPKTSTLYGSKIHAEKLAIFGQVVEAIIEEPVQSEEWQLLTIDTDTACLQRPIHGCDARLVLNGFLAIQWPPSKHYVLTSITRIVSRDTAEGTYLEVMVKRLGG